MHEMQFMYVTSRLEYIPAAHLLHKCMKDEDSEHLNTGKHRLYYSTIGMSADSREIPGDTCVVYGNTCASDPSVCFHRFPANPEKRAVCTFKSRGQRPQLVIVSSM